MARFVTDRNDPEIKRGVDKEPTSQHSTYLVLSEDEIKKGFIRPYRDSYKHKKCGFTTKMNYRFAETYARDPKFYGSTYCIMCEMHLPVNEFVWEGTDIEVGT